MTPNGAIMVDLFGPCTGLEAVEIWFRQTAPLDQVIITRDIVVAAAAPNHAAKVGAWFDDALERMVETGDLVQRERLSQIYLTMAYLERSNQFAYGSYIQESWFDLGNPGLTCRVAVNIMRSIVPSSVFHPSGSRPREFRPASLAARGPGYTQVADRCSVVMP